MDLEIEMLVAYVDYFSDGHGEIFGFRYHPSINLPETKDEHLRFFRDLMAGSSVQMKLIGDWKQIQSVIDYSKPLNSNRKHFNHWVNFCKHIDDQIPKQNVSINFDYLDETKGTFYELKTTIKITDSEETFLEKVKNVRDSVKLYLSEA